jgi:hypothetical protein
MSVSSVLSGQTRAMKFFQLSSSLRIKDRDSQSLHFFFGPSCEGQQRVGATAGHDW